MCSINVKEPTKISKTKLIANKPIKEIKQTHKMFNSKESITKHDINKTSTKSTDVNLTISIITLNIKGLNTTIKRQRLLDRSYS